MDEATDAEPDVATGGFIDDAFRVGKRLGQAVGCGHNQRVPGPAGDQRFPGTPAVHGRHR